MTILWNIEKIDRLLENFSAVSAITVSMFDRDKQQIGCTPRKMCKFCSKMREDDNFCAKCEQSNHHAFTTVEQTHAPYLYRCHAGLTELVAPILAGNQLLGYFMIGQFVPLEEKESIWEDVRSRCSDYPLPIPEKDVFFSEIRILSQQEILAWCEIVQACASYIWTSQYLTALNDEDFQAIDRYIQQHLTEPVCAEDICQETGIPRNRVYETVRRNTGLSVNTYIWSLRMERAKDLLAHTDLPVSEVANAVGVGDYSYFTKVFRKMHKLTPNQFRKERRK